MEFKEFENLVKNISIGKHLPDSIYIHVSAMTALPQQLVEFINKIAIALKIDQSNWNLIKLSRRDFRVSLLNYPGFDNDSYPALHTSYTIDLQKRSLRKAEYIKSENPPILHRKETFVMDDYPLRTLFEEITEEGEAIGLYENVRTIGFRGNWLRIIRGKNYFLNEMGRLVPIAEAPAPAVRVIQSSGVIQRHLTALDRNKLSNPMQIVARHNYLDGQMSVLDYGCGKGDDVRELEAHGIDVSGWDPAHYPDGVIINSDIVNLGFVLNVIEDRSERDETLRRAWQYAEKFLIVSVMIANEKFIQQFTPFKDGVVTSRNTFQRYYTQSEFREYVEKILGENAIAVGQGVLLVFKDKLEEQKFLLERQFFKRDWAQRTQRTLKNRERVPKKDILEKHAELFSDFWSTSLDLGRLPANDEFEHSVQLRKIAGSLPKALNLLLEHNGTDLFEKAEQAKKNDLLVYFALGLFEKRKAYKDMPESLKRDIKVFFDSKTEALNVATATLFKVGDVEIIEQVAKEAYETTKTGEFNEGHSWIFHKDVLGQLPPVLRIYVGCATQLYGDLTEIQLVKVHFTSGKVTLLGYSNWDSDTPLLLERIKIKLREQDVDFFDYVGRYAPQPLLNKSAFVLS